MHRNIFLYVAIFIIIYKLRNLLFNTFGNNYNVISVINHIPRSK